MNVAGHYRVLSNNLVQTAVHIELTSIGREGGKEEGMEGSSRLILLIGEREREKLERVLILSRRIIFITSDADHLGALIT